MSFIYGKERDAYIFATVYIKRDNKRYSVNFKLEFMENDFLRFSPKRVLYSVVMASTLWVGSPQLVFSEVRDVQAILQSGFVKGQVVDEKGEPIIGASISVKGTTNGVITDMDGNFTLNNISGGC